MIAIMTVSLGRIFFVEGAHEWHAGRTVVVGLLGANNMQRLTW